MSKISLHPAHDELLAQMRVTDQRLRRFRNRLVAAEVETDLRFIERVDELQLRCDGLAAELKTWTEVEIGTPTAVDDLAAAVDAIEADFEAVMSPPSDWERFETTLDRQVRVWRGRIDRLRLQAMLGTMEGVDELEELLPRLDRARSVALIELHNVTEDGRQVAGDVRRDVEATMLDVRKNVEDVVADVRRAVERAASTLTGGTK